MSVTSGPGSGELRVAFGGELDLVGVADLTASLDELLARRPQPLVIDLADVEFLDSSGVAVLVRLANRFERVRLRSAGAPVRRVVQVLGLADRLGLDGT